jgi:hypothetical protein
MTEDQVRAAVLEALSEPLARAVWILHAWMMISRCSKAG